MGHIPLPTVVIAVAMLAFSVLIVSKIGGRIPLSRRAQASLLLFGAASLLVGVYLHLGQSTAVKPPNVNPARQRMPEKEPFTFTFSPREVRWGDQVEIQTPFSGESVTVYLNGMPLPKKVDGSGKTISVAIPSGAKTGYFELERDGMRARSTQQISVTP